MKVVTLATLLLWSIHSSVHAVDRFDDIVNQLSGMLADLGREVITLHDLNRCDPVTLKKAERSNYDACVSTHPTQTCPATPSFGGDGPSGECGCGHRVDFGRSSNMIPAALMVGEDGNPTDERVIESIAFTQALDKYFIDTRAENQEFWDDFGIEPTAMYFGSETGHFRRYPATYQISCGNFDPTLRPWMIGARSGPKNIILVLDTSLSMTGRPLHVLKEAAKRVVKTLTVADRVAIVPFGTEARLIGQNAHMYEATNENIQVLLNFIDDLEPEGFTNFYDAFEVAFRVLEDSQAVGSTVDCNSAILFFTDGEHNPGDLNIGQQAVRDLVTRSLNETSLSHPIALMTYSVGASAAIHELPKQLACSHEFGVWSKIASIDDIVDALSSYYKLFSFGLSGGINEGFIAWSEPYVYSQTGILGTTASMPLYSLLDGRFIGVVGIDLAIDAINKAIGGNSEESIRRIAKQSIARCPRLELTLCGIESYRLQSSGETCTSSCDETELVDLEELRCPLDPSIYPTYLWADSSQKEVPYHELACCECPNEEIPATTPVPTSFSTGESSPNSPSNWTTSSSTEPGRACPGGLSCELFISLISGLFGVVNIWFLARWMFMRQTDEFWAKSQRAYTEANSIFHRTDPHHANYDAIRNLHDSATKQLAIVRENADEVTHGWRSCPWFRLYICVQWRARCASKIVCDAREEMEQLDTP